MFLVARWHLVRATSSNSNSNNNNNQPYLVRVTLNSKADKPVALIFGLNLNFECWFLWREKNRRTQTKTLGTRMRTNNKLNPHETPSLGIEPGPQRWETCSLTTAPSLHPQGWHYIPTDGTIFFFSNAHMANKTPLFGTSSYQDFQESGLRLQISKRWISLSSGQITIPRIA